MNSPITRQQIEAYVRTLQAIAEAVREAGSIGSGLLYAACLGANSGMTADQFNRMVDKLVEAGLVKRNNGALTWRGE